MDSCVFLCTRVGLSVNWFENGLADFYLHLNIQYDASLCLSCGYNHVIIRQTVAQI